MLLLSGGTLYDPANHINGEVRDLWIDGGKIVAPPPNAQPQRQIDLSGYVVMPGGIDMHCHIAGPKVNAARRMTPELRREAPVFPASETFPSGLGGIVPTTQATAALFASIGYTTAMDAAVPGLLARQTHEEFDCLPLLDKGLYALFGNNHFVMEHLQAGRETELDAYLAWALEASKGYTIKVVNPGGIENWKQISRKSLRELDEPVGTFGVSPREIVRSLAASADRLKLPHSLHLHCNNLGIPGNWETTLRTMEAVEGHRCHFAHIQFHSYAGTADDPGSFASATDKLFEYVQSHPNLTVDVGHVTPGQAFTMTGDAPFAQHLQRFNRGKLLLGDAEQESSCGVIPSEYRPQKRLVHAVQWAIALEWYLRMLDDPWRVALTSDHPNGGAFYRYPEIIALLMDRNLRQAALEEMPEGLRERTILADLDAEYTLHEIAIITRAAPARILGLKSKGHLGLGADADITVYTPGNDKQAMFANPRWVFKSGQLICEQGTMRANFLGDTHFVAPEFDRDFLPTIRKWFNEQYSLRFQHYGIQAEEIRSATQVAR